MKWSDLRGLVEAAEKVIEEYAERPVETIPVDKELYSALLNLAKEQANGKKPRAKLKSLVEKALERLEKKNSATWEDSVLAQGNLQELTDTSIQLRDFYENLLADVKQYHKKSRRILLAMAAASSLFFGGLAWHYYAFRTAAREKVVQLIVERELLQQRNEVLQKAVDPELRQKYDLLVKEKNLLAEQNNSLARDLRKSKEEFDAYKKTTTETAKKQEEELAKLTAELNTERKNGSDKAERIKLLETSVEDYKKRESELNSELNKKQAEIEKYNAAEIETTRKHAAEYARLATELAVNKEVISKKNDTIKTLEEKVSALEVEVENAKKKEAGLYAELAGKKAEIEALKKSAEENAKKKAEDDAKYLAEIKALHEKQRKIQEKLEETEKRVYLAPGTVLFEITSRDEIFQNFTSLPGNKYALVQKNELNDVSRIVFHTAGKKVYARIDYKSEARKDTDYTLDEDARIFIDKYRSMRAELQTILQKIQNNNITGINSASFDNHFSSFPNDIALILVYAKYCNTLSLESEIKKGIIWLKHALTIDQNNVSVHHLLALLYRKPEPVNARKEFETALRLSQNDPEIKSDYEKFLQEGEELINDPYDRGYVLYLQDGKMIGGESKICFDETRLERGLDILGREPKNLLRVAKQYLNHLNECKDPTEGKRKAATYVDAVMKQNNNPVDIQGLGQYLQGLLHELNNMTTNAALSYCKALELQPASTEFADSLIRLRMTKANELGELVVKQIDQTLSEVKKRQ